MQNDQQKNEDGKEEAFIEEKDISKPDFTFIPKGIHEWRQEGFYLVCRGCDLIHATYIGPDKILTGFEEGKPIIKNRKEIGMV